MGYIDGFEIILLGTISAFVTIKDFSSVLVFEFCVPCVFWL